MLDGWLASLAMSDYPLSLRRLLTIMHYIIKRWHFELFLCLPVSVLSHITYNHILPKYSSQTLKEKGGIAQLGEQQTEVIVSRQFGF